MKLFQYWDTPTPPDEVAELIGGLREQNPQLEHGLYDEEAAALFIAAHQGARHLSAFKACAVPAMQADYFRLCALHAVGGVYLDADFQAKQPLSSFFDQFPGDLMIGHGDFMLSGLMVFRRPGNPFIQAFLEVVTRNIEDRKFNSALMATGPHVGDAIHALVDPSWHAIALERQDDLARAMRFGELLDRTRSAIPVTAALVGAFNAITFVPTDVVRKWLRFVRAAYKASARHWTNWEGSIYRDAASAKSLKSLVAGGGIEPPT